MGVVYPPNLPEVFMLLLAMLACMGGANPEEEYVPWKPDGGEVVQLTTRDAVTLEADLYEATSAARPGLVLVHMDPSSGSHRSNWPGEFLQLLVDSDWNVLVLDRRGAGGSGGVATDAFETTKGAYDIEAAVLFLESAPLANLSLVAASNGTTSMIDYAAMAAAEGWTAPDTLNFVSVVSSTTNNHGISDVPATPALFSHPKSETDNNEPWKAENPGGWEFTEYDPGAHGTRMFQAAETLAANIHEWLERQVE
jgi:pimeloyl-ACP methyl ester carboxylesterase